MTRDPYRRRADKGLVLLLVIVVAAYLLLAGLLAVDIYLHWGNP